MSFLAQSHQVFFGHPACVISSTSHIVQHLTQSLSSLRSTCPNPLDLLFLIIKLTGSNLKSSLEFFTFLSLIQLNPHIHLIILIAVWFSFNSCSTFIGQVSLPCIRQLAYTVPCLCTVQCKQTSFHSTVSFMDPCEHFQAPLWFTRIEPLLQCSQDCLFSILSDSWYNWLLVVCDVLLGWERC